MLRVFGIRHHGPGSARQLLQALDHWQPDCLLIEAPADASAELQEAALLDLEPPVALVLYEEKDLRKALYYPFARFSPEWVALRWAERQQATIIAMDLPVSHQLAPQDASLLASTTDQRITQDPLSVVAALAGFADSEQWWDSTFERDADDLDRFAALLELITTLRQHYPQVDSAETLTREAFMRKTLRKTMKQGYERIAVVCGAWHAPALEQWSSFKAATDNQRLRGLPKVKTKAAWIPWSYPRLARHTGYGAGVISPAWYEQLFDHQDDAAIHWMVNAAQLLRKAGFDASPAHAQEAVRLARNLSTLRGQLIPALDDLRDAALSTLCAGSAERLALISEHLITGDRVGRVPDTASQVPLQRDLQAQLRSSRLNKYWEKIGEQWLKGNKSNPQGGIDLREPTDLLKSQVLYQLQLIDIPWGQLQETGANDLGAFKEVWRLQWEPEFALRIMEAAMWGNTLVEAAAHRLQQQPADTALLQLAQLVLIGLRAGLNQAVPAVIQQMTSRAALTRDVSELLAGLPALVRIIQYGDARRTDVTRLAMLTEELIPRVSIGLAGLATSVDEEQAQTLLQDLLRTHRALVLLDLPPVATHWWPAWQQMADLPGIHPLIKGAAVRLLFEQDRLNLVQTQQRLAYSLSAGNEPLTVAQWLSGFLHGSGLLLLHHPPLWKVVDDWVSELPWDDLEPILPILRRTFANFSPGERQRILARVSGQSPVSTPRSADTALDPASADERQHTLLTGLAQWLPETD